MLLAACSGIQQADVREQRIKPAEVYFVIKSTPIWPDYLDLYLSMLLPDYRGLLVHGYGIHQSGEYVSHSVTSEHAKEVIIATAEFLIEHAQKHDVNTASKPFDKWTSDEMFAFFLTGFGRYPVGVELGPEWDYAGLLEKMIERKDSPAIVPYYKLMLAYLMETEGNGYMFDPPENPGPEALRAMYSEVADYKNAPDCLRASALVSLLGHEESKKARKQIAHRIVSEFSPFKDWPFFQEAQGILDK